MLSLSAERAQVFTCVSRLGGVACNCHITTLRIMCMAERQPRERTFARLQQHDSLIGHFAVLATEQETAARDLRPSCSTLQDCWCRVLGTELDCAHAQAYKLV